MYEQNKKIESKLKIKKGSKNIYKILAYMRKLLINYRE